MLTIVGDDELDIIELPNFRATAISKDGALWFSKTNAKEMKYLLEMIFYLKLNCLLK